MSFWRTIGKSAAMCAVEAFASTAGARIADRLLQKIDDGPKPQGEDQSTPEEVNGE